MINREFWLQLEWKETVIDSRIDNSPMQLKPLGSRTYPGVQLQTYEPGILMQACAQRSLLLTHSSISEKRET